MACAITSSPTRFTMRSIFSTLTRIEDCSPRWRLASAAPAPGSGSKKPNLSEAGALAAATGSKSP